MILNRLLPRGDSIKQLSPQACYHFYGSLIITRMIYIALLRGINVGGKNMIDMKRLKMTFESLGFTSVTTYINSGNIVFEHVDENAALQTHVRKTGDVAEEQRAKEDKADLTSLIEQAIKRDFQLEIKTVVVNSNELDEICQELPITWVKSKVVTDPKDIGFESNSQHGRNGTLYPVRCY